MSNYQAPVDIIRIVKKLEDRVEHLEKSNPLNNGTVDDGGITIKAAGTINWYDLNEHLRFQFALGELLNMSYFNDQDDLSVLIGEAITPGDDPGDGVRVLDNGEFTTFSATELGFVVRSIFARTAISIRPESNHYIHLSRTDDRGILRLSETDANNSIILGGATEDAGEFQVAVKFLGYTAIDPGIEARNAADTDYVSMKASSFDILSTAESKVILGDYEESALDKVMSVPVQRWKSNKTPQKLRVVQHVDATPETTILEDPIHEPRERVGPIAEDMPEELQVPSESGLGIDLGGTVWVLWKAVQEQNELIKQLQAEVAELKKGTIA